METTNYKEVKRYNTWNERIGGAGSDGSKARVVVTLSAVSRYNYFSDEMRQAGARPARAKQQVAIAPPAPLALEAFPDRPRRLPFSVSMSPDGGSLGHALSCTACTACIPTRPRALGSAPCPTPHAMDYPAPESLLLGDPRMWHVR